MSATKGASSMRSERLLEIGNTMWERMTFLGFDSFNADKIRRSVMKDRGLFEIVNALMAESATNIYNCGYAISAALRRVVESTEGKPRRLENVGRVRADGTADAGGPMRFRTVIDAPKPEPEPAKPSASVLLSDCERILVAIHRAADRIIDAINAKR